MTKLPSIIVSVCVAVIAMTVIASAMTLLGVSGGACSGLFIPSQLPSGQYQAVLDGSTVAWSGSNFGTTTNAGSLGGSIVARDGTVVKGTQLNSIDTVAFSGSNSLKIVSENWSGDIHVFGVFAVPANTLSLLAFGWQAPSGLTPGTQGWVVYPRINSSGTVNSVTLNAGDYLGFASGSNTGQPDGMAATPITDTSHHINSYLLGSTSAYRKDGLAVTLKGATTGTVNSFTAQDVIFGNSANGGGPEFFAGTVAYLLAGNPPTAGNIQKLEGWAAWRFNLVSALPGGHPYKSAPPPC